MTSISIIITTTPPEELEELPEDLAGNAGDCDDPSNKIRVNKKIMSATKTSSKVYEPRTYKEVVSDPIHTKQ